MNQTDYSTTELKELLDASLANEDMVFGMMGVLSKNCPVATGFVSPTQVEALYDLASKLYAAGEYQKADALFQMLCYYKNDDARFWMGLGGCRQAVGNPESAVEAYTAACYLQNFTSPQPLFFSALCLLRMSEREAAMRVLHFATQVDESNTPMDHECREKAQLLLNSIQSEMKKEQ